MHILHLNSHAGCANWTCLLVQVRDQACIVLPNRSRYLREVALSCSVRGRLYLERIRTIGLLLKVELSGYVFHWIDGIVNLEVLKCDFFVVLLLVFGRRDVNVWVFGTFQSSLCILGAFLHALIDCVLRSLGSKAVLSLVWVHNSIKWPDIIIATYDHWLYHIELKVRLGDVVWVSGRALAAFRGTRRHGSFQIELPRVLVLCWGWMVHSDNCTLVEGSEDIVLLVAKLGVICGVYWRCGARWDHLGWMLVCGASFYGQRLDAPISADVICRRYHWLGLCVGWR